MAVTMVRSVHRASDNNRVGAMVATTVIEESNFTMVAVMEAMSVTIDHDTIIVPVMVSVVPMGLNYDRVGRGDRGHK
ncbi:hypothetical protein [Mesorhizobium japonicum]|uniref:hypothetical protein n=1 Tax=Mesorhizobium japonicum TaxID=2066070 RepID=UPI0003229A06|nr:hypothetical protein [Mesorhizobium japonicum]